MNFNFDKSNAGEATIGSLEDLLGGVSNEPATPDEKRQQAEEALGLTSVGKEKGGLSSLLFPNDTDEDDTDASEVELPTPIDEDDSKKDTDTSEPTIEDIIEGSTVSSSEYKKAYDILARSNDWEEIDSIEVDGEEVAFDELEFTEELFEQLVAQQAEMAKEQLLSNKIDGEGLSDFTKRLIQIEKDGGNVSAALQAYESVGNPLESADLSNPDDQQALVYLRLEKAGLPEDEILSIIEGYKEKGQLAEKAARSYDEMTDAYKKYLVQLEDDAKSQKVKREESIKTYRKTMKETLKNEFKFNESYARRLTDLATKETEKKTYELDELYRQVRQDPNKVIEIALLLTDREEFIKHITADALRRDKLESLSKQKVLKINTGKGGKNPKIERNREDGDVDLSLFK